jgi:AraC-like DNA-binding protein
MHISDRYIRATVLIGFRELVESMGGNIENLLAEAGIEQRVLADPDLLMSYLALGRLYELAARQLDQPSIGLEFSLRSPPHHPAHGPLVLLGNFTNTMQEWVDLAIQYWRFHTDAFTMRQLTDEATGQTAFRYVLDSVAFPTRQLTEAVQGNIVGIVRAVGHFETDNPTVVRFQHARPRDTSLHDKLFRCPLEFGAEHTELVFDPKYLAYPTAGKLQVLKPMLGYYIRSRIQAMPIYDQSMATTVALAIRSTVGTGKCNIEFVAASLGLSSKKLQRLLAGEGATFSDILERERIDMARKLLLTSDAPVANIAGLLDYSATAPFTQAFKRWTGQSPLEYRKSERGSRAQQDKT